MDWATQDLSLVSDRLAPSGATEIRLLPSLARGEIVHATTSAQVVSKPAILESVTEFFYVLEGRGELWRGDATVDDVVALLPGRCVKTRPGTAYQYRTGSESLAFLVITAPRWQHEQWSQQPRGWWSDHELGHGPAPRAEPQRDWTADLRPKLDYAAPDGSEIRLLLDADAGGCAHCTLGPGRCSAAVRHRTVDEIWFVLGGRGQMWRRSASDETAEDELRPGRFVTIPVGTAFQFRASDESPLRILIGTFPKWPGPDEGGAGHRSLLTASLRTPRR
jgi:mannose-6-phosphate isomerase-like protein (cupin superfamily)